MLHVSDNTCIATITTMPCDIYNFLANFSLWRAILVKHIILYPKRLGYLFPVSAFRNLNRKGFFHTAWI